jgi:hypothetical protein
MTLILHYSLIHYSLSIIQYPLLYITFASTS